MTQTYGGTKEAVDWGDAGLEGEGPMRKVPIRAAVGGSRWFRESLSPGYRGWTKGKMVEKCASYRRAGQTTGQTHATAEIGRVKLQLGSRTELETGQKKSRTAPKEGQGRHDGYGVVFVGDSALVRACD